MFLIGGWFDSDSGGFVAGEVVRNLQICIPEKTAKVNHLQERFPEWWLLLEDGIGYGRLDEHEVIGIRSHISVNAPWRRIILASPIDDAFYEI